MGLGVEQRLCARALSAIRPCDRPRPSLSHLRVRVVFPLPEAGSRPVQFAFADMAYFELTRFCCVSECCVDSLGLGWPAQSGCHALVGVAEPIAFGHVGKGVHNRWVPAHR